MPETSDAVNVIMQQNGADGSGAIPFCGCVCCFSACFTEMPECIGCAGKGNCLCYHFTSRSCKLPSNDPLDKDIWFLCARGHSHLGPFEAICTERAQYFCLDGRLAIPPVDEIPCMVTFCFFTLFYKGVGVYQFFKSLDELDKKITEAPPAQPN